MCLLAFFVRVRLIDSVSHDIPICVLGIEVA